jgi:YYY domain-containing protein
MYSKWLALLLVGVFGYLLVGKDLMLVLTWWGALLLIGLIFMPVTERIFYRFFDKGYLFSKILGIVFLTFGLWMFSSLRVIPFSHWSVYASLVVAVGVIWFWLKGWRRGKELLQTKNLDQIVIYEEALFLLGLIFFTFVRGQAPNNGVEKFMDFAFLNNLLRTDYMPPMDMWFAGKPANYYYYGQYVFAFLTKLTGIKSAITYNLGMATLFSFGFSLTFALTANLVYLTGKRKVLPIILAGLISASLLALGGNLHTFVYTTALPFLKNVGLYHGEVKAYFYADPRSYIGTNPPTNDNLITEYPSYSYVLGDLHAQIIDVFFVLTFLAILLAFVARILEENKSQREPAKWYYLPREMIMMILMLPVMWMTNAWDYPIYAIVFMVFLLGINLIRYDWDSAIILTFINTGKLVIVSLLLLVPFLWTFINPTQGIHFTKLNHLLSPIYLFQMFVVWGYQLCFVAAFFIYIFRNEPKLLTAAKIAAAAKAGASKKKVKVNALPESAASSENKLPKWRQFLAGMPAPDLFVSLVSICAIGLLIGSEVFYQKDVSGVDWYRANTVWKVTLQAFVLFDVVVGYIAIRIFFVKRSRVKEILIGIPVALAIILAMMYPFWSIGPAYNNLSNYQHLDGAVYLKDNYPDDYAAAQWLNEHQQGQAVIVEANGDSYSDYGRISSQTGLATIIGWFVHQWYWRGDQSGPERDQRVTDVATVYESPDLAATQAVLQKYKVKYIILGKLERAKFKQLNDQKILSLGTVVFDSKDTKIVQVSGAGL